MVMSLRSKWAAGCVALRLRIELDMRPPRALPAAHFERNPPGHCQLAIFRVAPSARMDPDTGASLAP